MAASMEFVAELALVNLAFAQAEFAMSDNRSEHARRGLEHIERAMENLKRLAPQFDACPRSAKTA